MLITKEKPNIIINTNWCEKQSHWLNDKNETIIAFNFTSNIIWFLRSNCENLINYINTIAKYKDIKSENIKIGIDSHIRCPLLQNLVDFGYKYKSELSDSTIILSYFKNDEYSSIILNINEYRSQYIPLSREVIETYYEHTKKDYEIAHELVNKNNHLCLGNYMVKGSSKIQSVSPNPHRYLIHSHLSEFYKKYNIFMYSFSLTDILYLLNHQDIVDVLYLAAKEGIYMIKINDVYDGKLSPYDIDKIEQYLYKYIDYDEHTHINAKNIHKLHNVFKKFTNLTGKTIDIYSNTNDTPIFVFCLDTWDILNCKTCI
jgi:hypothetical protein